MTRAVALFACAFFSLAAMTLLRDEPPPSSLAPTGVATAPPPVVLPAEVEVEAERVDAGGPFELEACEDVCAALGQAALPRVGAAGVVRAALRDAPPPGELGRRLHDAVTADPRGAGEALLEALVTPQAPEVALELAQALARCLHDDGLRRDTVEALAAAGPEVRAVGLLALLGRAEPECVALARRSFERDPDAARATAAFLLGLTYERLPAADAAAVRDTAREALARSDTPERVREEALGLVGHAGATATDVAAIERALLEDPSAAVRGRAFLALVECGQPAGRTRAVLERAAQDAATPEPLRRAIEAELSRAS